MTTEPRTHTAIMPKPTQPPHYPSYELHPAAQEAAAAYSDALKELEAARAQLAKTQQELEVERRIRQELEHQLDKVTQARDYYQRYAVQVNTNLNIIAEAALQARDKSIEYAKGSSNGATAPELTTPTSSAAADIAADIEKSIAELTRERQ